MHWFVTGKTKFYTLKIYFWASFWTKLKKKKHDLWYCIYSIFALTVKFLADTFIPMWLLRKSSFAYIVSCISFTKVLFSVRLKSTLCAGSWRLGTHREVWEDIEEKKKKVSWGKQPMENKHLSANAWCEINVLRFFPKGGSRQADVMGQSLQAQDRTDRETVHTMQSSEWHSFYCSQR